MKINPMLRKLILSYYDPVMHDPLHHLRFNFSTPYIDITRLTKSLISLGATDEETLTMIWELKYIWDDYDLTWQQVIDYNENKSNVS